MENSQQKKKANVYLGRFVLIFLLAALFVAVYTLILQKNYKTNTLEAAVERDIECSDAIHTLVSDRFNKADYDEINTRADMDTPRYQELQQSLNELRTLNSTRYLYTAKRNSEGKLIYLVDGLDLGAEDFAYPGTYIEDEMIPYIDMALSGENVYSQDIVIPPGDIYLLPAIRYGMMKPMRLLAHSVLRWIWNRPICFWKK